MEQIRARVDAIVKDPKTAAALKPYYPYGCKRPTFHDEYLPTFNLPHVHLVDTAPRGVSEINERGVVHEGVEYPLDVLIYATGFQWMGTSTFNRITGRGGQGIDNMDLSRRQDAIVAVFPVGHRDQVMLVTDGGMVIRCPVHDIRIARRRSQGVVIFKLGEGERVVSAARLPDVSEDGDNGNGAAAETADLAETQDSEGAA
jgi:hypothetical protein